MRALNGRTRIHGRDNIKASTHLSEFTLFTNSKVISCFVLLLTGARYDWPREKFVEGRACDLAWQTPQFDPDRICLLGKCASHETLHGEIRIYIYIYIYIIIVKKTRLGSVLVAKGIICYPERGEFYFYLYGRTMSPSPFAGSCLKFPLVELALGQRENAGLQPIRSLSNFGL